MRYRRLVFRIVYASIYLLFYLLPLGLLLVTVSDVITQSLRNGQNYNAWIVAVCLVAAAVVVGFVYVFRLYINKTALASIPRAWVPVGRGDVKDAVYRAVAAGLDRSALVALGARPRADADARPSAAAARDLGVALPPCRAAWGAIEHRGWASPLSPDMAGLQYAAVLAELPDLVEGKALALAPPDPTAAPGRPAVDPDAARLLQRGPGMSLRGYLDRLAELGVVRADATTAGFVARYEHARFSNRPICNARFRELMHLLAQVLRAMRPADLDGPDAGWAAAASASASESDIENDAPLDSDPPSPRPPRGDGGASPARARRPCRARQPSSPSLRSAASSSAAGSVIRLATREDPPGLPYVLGPGGVG